jgi:hypothetical protein
MRQVRLTGLIMAGTIALVASSMHLVIPQATPAIAEVIPCNQEVARSTANGSKTELRADCHPAGSRINVKGVALTVPDVGTGIGLADVMPAGAGAGTALTVFNDGQTIIIADQNATATEGPAPYASLPKCSDNSWIWTGYKNPSFNYYISTAGRPGSVSAADFSAEVSFAHNVIDQDINACGLTTGTSSVSITNKGTTTRRSMTTDGSCGGAQKDGYDNIDFGPLSGSAIGRTCWYYSTSITEADVRLNSATGWFRTLPNPCSSKYEMASVLLHEFGHVFGLAHVDEATHPNLVMSTNSTVCSYQDHHWGWGDYNNMTAHY